MRSPASQPTAGPVRLHSLAWLAWVAAALIALSSTRNPMYLSLVLLCVAFVGLTVRTQVNPEAPQLPVVRIGIFIVVLSTIFNALTGHFGETVVFVIPGRIPLLSGPVTLESIVFGFLNGLVLAGFLAVFTVLNQALPVGALTRLIPRAFYPVAVVVAIAITYVPTTLRQMGQIREAQTVRGYRWRGWRDWAALFMPLMVGGLERAMGLTEAMMARGFATGDQPDHPWTPRLALIVGSLMLVLGWLLRATGWGPVPGLVLLTLGLVLIFITLWLIGRRVPRTTYRQESWSSWDWFILLGSAITGLVFLLPISALDRSSLDYYPYPKLTLPSFNPLIGLSALGLLAPGITLAWQQLRGVARD